MTSAVLEFAEGIGIIKTFNLLGEKSKEVSESFEESSKREKQTLPAKKLLKLQRRPSVMTSS